MSTTEAMLGGKTIAPRIPLSERISPYLLVAPAAIALFAMLLAPSAAIFLFSVTDWQLGASTFSFVGLDNYSEMIRDPVFRQAIINTLTYVAIVMPVSVGLGLSIAMLIESSQFGRAFFRAAYFLPATSTLVAMAIVWQFMMHPSLGMLNLVLRSLGFSPVNFLGDASTVLFALCAIGVWQFLGFNMVLFLAGLKAVPKDLYEAGEIDGVNTAWERFRRITWPMLGPTTMFVVTITTIESFKVFELVAVLTKGGPKHASDVLLYTIYAESFQYLRTGYGSALTVVFLSILLVLSLNQARSMDRRVHYS
jgi:multiple sugar transport system permease protein